MYLKEGFRNIRRHMEIRGEKPENIHLSRIGEEIYLAYDYSVGDTRERASVRIDIRPVAIH